MASIGINTRAEISELRDWFLAADESLFKDLGPNAKQKILAAIENVKEKYCRNYKTFAKLLELIKKIIERMEAGYYIDENNKMVPISYELAEKYEKRLYTYLAAIEDLELVLILEKLPDWDNFSMGL